MGSFFQGCSNVTIYGGSFNDVKGNLTVFDNSRHNTNVGSSNKYNNNMVNAHNDNSTRINPRDSYEEIPSMPSSSAGYRQEDYPGLWPPQRSQPPSFGPPHFPSTGPFQAAFPQQMGVGGPPGPHTSVSGANIQQLDQQMGRSFDEWLKFTLSQTQSMAAGNSGGNYDPQTAYSSSSHNAEGIDPMNTGMANLSLNDFQPQVPPHLSPPASFSRAKSDPQIGLKATDQMGSRNSSTSNLSPYNNIVRQASHSNPSLAPHINESSFHSLPTETPPYGNNLNSPPRPASTSPFNFPPSSSGGLDFNTYCGNLTKQDHGVYHTNIDSFNVHNNTVKDSFNDNSLVDFTGKHSATGRNKKRGFPDPDVPIETRKKKNSGVRSFPAPNQMDEESSSDEADEQIPTAAEKKKKAKKWSLPVFGRK